MDCVRGLIGAMGRGLCCVVCLDGYFGAGRLASENQTVLQISVLSCP